MSSIIWKMYNTLDWLTKFAFVNLLWVLFNLPIIFFLINLLLSNSMEHIQILITSIMVLLPITFFPATTAMFGVVRKCIMKSEVGVFRTYLRFYKENYKQSFLGGIFFSSIAFILINDYFYSQNYLFLQYIFLFLFVVLYIVLLYFFSNLVHTETKFFNNLKNAFLFVILNPFISIVVIVITIGIVYIGLNYLTFILPFYSGSIISFVTLIGYLKIFNIVENQE